MENGKTQKVVEEGVKRWKEILDEMAGTEYDCSFDCGSHLGDVGYCYHGELFRDEEMRAMNILKEIVDNSKEPEKTLKEAEKECRRPERDEWGMRRGLDIIEKFKKRQK